MGPVLRGPLSPTASSNAAHLKGKTGTESLISARGDGEAAPPMGFKGKCLARPHGSQPPSPPPHCSEWLQPAPDRPSMSKSPGTPTHCEPVQPLVVPRASLTQPPASLLLNLSPHVFLQIPYSNFLLGTGGSRSATCPEPGLWDPSGSCPHSQGSDTCHAPGQAAQLGEKASSPTALLVWAHVGP